MKKLKLELLLSVAFIYTAICTSCRKKHAERLLNLGWQNPNKQTEDQAAAVPQKDVERFVE